jgi:hypothetical protein
MTSTFGPGIFTPSWGERFSAAADAAWGHAGIEEELPSEEHDGLAVPGPIDLGGGFTLVFNPEAFRKIMHTAEITAQVEERAAAITEEANRLAITVGARYAYTVSNRPENIRARARVRPDNYKAVVDDEYHETLLKALANVGSDPKPVTEPLEDNQSLEEGDADYAQEPEQEEAPVAPQVEEDEE